MKKSTSKRAMALAGVSLLVALAAGAETDVGGGWVLSGDVAAGGRGVLGKDGSAKFDEYRSIRSGPVTNGRILLEDEDSIHYLRSYFDFVSSDDQTYSLGFGRYGHYGVELDYMEFPHTYSKRSVTNFMRSGHSFFLPNGWDYTDVPTSATAPQNVFPETLRFRELVGGASAYVRPQLGVEFSASYHILDKRGDQPYSILQASFNRGTPFSSYASPIDEKIHTVEGTARLARERWTFEFDYLGSIFDNDIGSEVVANQAASVDGMGNPISEVNESAFGRLSVAPDNSAHQLSLATSYLVPTSFPSRLAGTFSFGIRTQNDNFLPYTINPALNPGELPRKDLDGRVYTFLGNVVYTARINPDWNAEARYRIYSLDNQSNQITFPVSVTVDNSVGGELRSNAFDFTRQNVNLDTSYRLDPMATLSAGFDWENWDRSKSREVRHSNEYEGKLGLRLRPNDRLDLLTTWNLGYREYNQYTTFDPMVELDQLRKFDVADRLREQVNLRWAYTPGDDLVLALTGGWSYSDYDNSKFGMRDDCRWNIGLDIDYTPIERVTLGAWYSYDVIETKQRSITRSGAAELPADAPERIWKSNSDDTAHTAGVEVFAKVVPDLIDWQNTFTVQIARAQTHDKGGTASEADLANFPDITDNLYNFSSEVTWHALEQLDFIAGYRYEEYDGDNFRFKFGDPGTNTGDDNLYLNNGVDDYHAHVVTVTARYQF